MALVLFRDRIVSADLSLACGSRARSSQTRRYTRPLPSAERIGVNVVGALWASESPKTRGHRTSLFALHCAAPQKGNDKGGVSQNQLIPVFERP
jgi:hypothetical protein